MPYEDCIKLVDMFLLHTSTFKGDIHNKLRREAPCFISKSISDSIRELVAFTLEDHIGKWYNSLWSDERKITSTWAEFEGTFTQ